MPKIIRIKKTGTGPCANALVQNSDLSYSVSVPSGGTLGLPDITHTDSDLSPKTLPAQTPMICTPGATPSGIAYDRPGTSGRTTSYHPEDEGDNLANGVYNYTGPVSPVSYARQDYAHATPFLKLIDNNAFGNKDRFTDDAGGQTYANDYMIDHITGLGWYMIKQGTSNWATALNNAASSSAVGFNDWRIPYLKEVLTLVNSEILNTFNYSPWNTNLLTNGQGMWTSGTDAGTTTSALLVRAQNSAGVSYNSLVVSKLSASYYNYICRTHYT